VAMTEVAPGELLPYCPCGQLMHYRADYGAPGCGQSWQCEAASTTWLTARTSSPWQTSGDLPARLLRPAPPGLARRHPR
jgi:hypothetical protein